MGWKMPYLRVTSSSTTLLVMPLTRPVSSAYRAPASLKLVAVAPGKLAVVNRLVAPVLTGSLAASPKLMEGTKGDPVQAVVQELTCVKLPPKFHRCSPFAQVRLALPCLSGVL